MDTIYRTVGTLLILLTLADATLAKPLTEDDLKPPEQVTVARVMSGDSFYIRTNSGSVPVRLLGVVAPRKEFDKRHFDESKKALGKLIANKELTIRQGVVVERGIKRRVVLAWLEEDLLNREVVASGYAWNQPLEFAAPELQAAFDEAQKAKRGFWSEPEPPLSPWKTEAFIEAFGVDSKRGKKPNISAQELFSYVKDYDIQYTEAVTLLEKARAYHDPHGQRHKLRAGQLHIRNIVSHPPEETAEERTMYEPRWLGQCLTDCT